MNEAQKRLKTRINLLLILLLLLSVFSGAYRTLRFGAWMIEGDASRQTLSADGIINTQTINNIYSYSNGMGFGALLASISLVTDLTIQTAQLASGMLVFILFLVAFITFKEMLGGAASGLLAAYILLLQPDFLFYVVRGSHERLTWTFALLMLFFLIRSQRRTHSTRQFLVYITLFYLTYWAMVLTNAYFASTFLLAILIGLVMGSLFDLIIIKKGKTDAAGSSVWRERLIIISLSCFILVYSFVAYTYQPAQNLINIFGSLVDKLSLLFLNVDRIEDPSSYQYLTIAWRSNTAYRLVTGTQWIISAAGFVIWVWTFFHLNRLKAGKRILWQMYSSFGLLLLIGVLADFAGFLSENLQMRMFTPFSIFSSAMFVHGLQSFWPRLTVKFNRAILPVASILAVLAFVGVQLKITNEPLIANTWFFFSPAETNAYTWMESYLNNQRIWVDTWDHLREVFYFQQGYIEKRSNTYYYSARAGEVQNLLLTDLVQFSSIRKGLILPSVEGKLRVYDNGSAQFFRNRPLTPYQR